MGETFERLAEELVDKYLAPQIELETRVKCIKLLKKNNRNDAPHSSTVQSQDEALFGTYWLGSLNGFRFLDLRLLFSEMSSEKIRYAHHSKNDIFTPKGQ